MRYLIKGKLFFHLRGDCQIEDDTGHSVYFVHYKGLKENSYSFQEEMGKELFSIKAGWIQRKIEIYRDNICVATIEREGFSFSPKFKIELNAEILTIQSSFWRHKLIFNWQGKPVFTALRRFSLVLPELLIDIPEGEDYPLVLAITVAVYQDIVSDNRGT